MNGNAILLTNRPVALLLLLAAVATAVPTTRSVAQTSAPVESSPDFGLSSKPLARIGRSEAIVQVCLSKDGAIDKVTLLKGTGDAAADQKIMEGIKKMPSLKPRPADMPPCVTLTIKA